MIALAAWARSDGAQRVRNVRDDVSMTAIIGRFYDDSARDSVAQRSRPTRSGGADQGRVPAPSEGGRLLATTGRPGSRDRGSETSDQAIVNGP